MSMTPDRVKKLARTPEGLCSLDAMVARALGWVRVLARAIPVLGVAAAWRWEHPDGRQLNQGNPPPPYVSGADWRLWGEMFEKLAACPTRHKDMIDAQVIGAVLSVVGIMLLDGEAPTLPLALAKALAAAGLLEEKEDGK